MIYEKKDEIWKLEVSARHRRYIELKQQSVVLVTPRSQVWFPRKAKTDKNVQLL